MIKLLTIIFVSSCLLITGCSTNMLQKSAGGAVTGAVGSSVVGALTDLVLDGRVNTDRLARNLTSGAIAGGMAGAAVGAQQDHAKAQQETAKQHKQDTKQADKELQKKIGPENYNALVSLINCDLENAYRNALKASNSSKKDYKEAGFIIQALIDIDRNNESGAEESIDSFMSMNDDMNKDEVMDGLKTLHGEIQDERKIIGVSCK